MTDGSPSGASSQKSLMYSILPRFPDLYDGVIEITPIPTVEELNAHVWGEEFHACIIEQAEFEAIWETHTYDGALVQVNDGEQRQIFGFYRFVHSVSSWLL